MTPMVYLIPALVVTVFFLVRAGILEKQRQIYVLKPLSTLIVIEVASLSFLQPANTGVMQTPGSGLHSWCLAVTTPE